MATESPSRVRFGPTLPSATERRLWSLAVAALLADLVLTYYGITYVGLSEQNPFVASLLVDHGFGALAVTKVAALAVAVAGRQVVQPAYRWLAPVCLAIPWFFASAVNAALIAVAL